jgi:hypothetical protein
MFTTPLDLREHAEPGEWVVISELVWQDGQGRIVVPRGFVTDLASIPPPARSILDVNGPSRAPAVLHDWLYCSRIVGRSLADELFRRALRSRGVGAIERNIFWSAVRGFGWLYWNRRSSGLKADDFAKTQGDDDGKACS